MNTADPALVAAIQFLSKQVANLPLATIAATSNSSAVQRVYVANSNWAAPVPVVIEGGSGGKEGSGSGGGEGGGSGGGGPLARVTRGLTAVGSALGTAFGALLGPLGTLTTFLTSATSGFQVFSSAIALFAQSFGPIIMPVLFVFSTGLVAAAETVKSKLLPAMDGFTKWVLAAGLPAMETLASAAGKAAQALIWIADSKLGRLLGGRGSGPDGRPGGGLGGFDPLSQLGAVDRLTSADAIGTGNAEENARFGTVMGADIGDIKWLNRKVQDVVRLSPAGGESLAGAHNWATRESMYWSARAMYGEEALGRAGIDSSAALDNYSGIGTGGAGGNNAMAEAARKTLAEYQFQMNPKSRIGDVAGNWSAAQQSVLSMSPFQRETLELQRKQLAKLEEALARYDRTGVYTKPDEDTGETTGWIAGLVKGS